MTATLQEIHKNPGILDRAIAAKETLDITAQGKPAATLIPVPAISQEEARRKMASMFLKPTWDFAVGVAMNRDERNSRG